MSRSQSSLALEIKEEELESEFDLFIQEKHLSMAASNDCDPQIVKVTGSITVSF